MCILVACSVKVVCACRCSVNSKMEGAMHYYGEDVTAWEEFLELLNKFSIEYRISEQVCYVYHTISYFSFCSSRCFPTNNKTFSSYLSVNTEKKNEN